MSQVFLKNNLRLGVRQRVRWPAPLRELFSADSRVSAEPGPEKLRKKFRVICDFSA
jgi:hypothetical protein